MADLTTPYTPTPIYFEDSDLLVYNMNDEPTVARSMDVNFDLLVDMASRVPVGFQLHCASTVFPTADKALLARAEAAEAALTEMQAQRDDQTKHADEWAARCVELGEQLTLAQAKLDAVTKLASHIEASARSCEISADELNSWRFRGGAQAYADAAARIRKLLEQDHG